jgi:hypothetical protein
MNNYPHKRTLVILIFFAMLAFLCGAIARSYFQDGRPFWLYGLSAMMPGFAFVLIAAATGLSAYDSWKLGDHGRFYNVARLIFSVGVMILGTAIFIWGLMEVVNVFMYAGKYISPVIHND